MSRIGKQPITVPQGVTVSIDGATVHVKGPKGEIVQSFSPEMDIVLSEETITVARPSDHPRHRSLHGLTRALIANMVTGVSEGYRKALEIVGVGYKAELIGNKLNLVLGYSHPILITPPEGITFVVAKPTQLAVEGISKQLVGEIAAAIRGYRPPEPYKGKGVRYEGEKVRRKAGKTAA
jgi:large subunit ribosomal protein L6